MLPATRRDQILTIIQDKQSATVQELSDLLRISQVTVRQDLNRLAADGLVVRTRGGALASESLVAANRAAREGTFAARDRANAEIKRRIGEAAAALVQPRESILLDASTTALYVARALLRRQDLHDLTIITNGLHTALELSERPDITTLLTGGIVRTTAVSLIGSIVWDVVSKINASKGFFGAHGISVSQGLTDVHLQEANVKKAMLERCQKVIAVADGTKFGKVGLVSFASLEDLHLLITDSSAPAEALGALRARGLEILVV